LEECIPAPNDTECQISDKLFQHAVNDFLSTLSEEKRNVFLRRYWFTEPMADIARRYGMREATVRTSLFRSREKLRRHLEKEGLL
jgi:RNA polymerase sigma-70 factor (ECF subfamily)